MPVQEFLERCLEVLFGWRDSLEEGMATARSTPPHQTARELAAAALPEKMEPAERRAILDAVARRERHEATSHGRTRWAASQALSWVGTHEVRGLHGWRLRRAATELLVA